MSSTDRILGFDVNSAIKTPVRCATTANITLSGIQTIDGQSLAIGDRVLVKDQTLAIDNGIYQVSAGAWSRSLDFSSQRNITRGVLIYVNNGTVNADKLYHTSTDNPVIGITDILFSKFISDTSATIGSAVNAISWGLLGDGTTDESATIQAFINANKGKHLIFDAGHTWYFGGVTMIGSSYDKTQIDFQGYALLKKCPASGTYNFQGAVWAGLAIQGVTNFKIDGFFDGNLANQPQQEQIICLVLAGVKNGKSEFLSFREVAGDGLYISQANLIANSTNTDGMTFGIIEGVNSVNAGRNLVSHISGDNISADIIRSYQIGGTINGAVMPGGWDTESDFSYQSASNLTIGSVSVTTAGTTGVAIQGTTGSSPANVNNVNIGTIRVINTSASTILDELNNLTQTYNKTLSINNTANVIIGEHSGVFTNSWGWGVSTSNNDGLLINSGRVSHVSRGVILSSPFGSVIVGGSTKNRINIDVDTVCRYGYEVDLASNGVVNGRVTTPISGFYPTSLFGVFMTGGYTQTEMIYKISVPYNANWVRGYKNDTVSPNTFGAGCCISDITFTKGAAWSGYIIMVDAALPVYNAIGYTDSILGQPTGGPHILGQYIKNGNPVVGQPKGWYCTVSGTPGTWVSEGNL